MAARITEKMLKSTVKELNELTGNPLEAYGEAGANVGNYNLSQAYGGVCLHQMSNNGGGVTDVFRTGHIPKRELFSMLCAFINGIVVTQAKVA
jgi:hypothetical protein